MIHNISKTLKESARHNLGIEVITQYIASKLDVSNQEKRSGDIDKFYELLKEIVKEKQIDENIKTPIEIIEAVNPEEFNGEIITFHLKSRRPGVFGKGEPMSDVPPKAYRAVYRGSEPDKVNPGYSKMTFSLFYDNIIEITCWAGTNKQANYRALWFEELMNEYIWLFKLNGLIQVLYLGREEDVTESGMGIHGRPLRYYVRSERIFSVSEKNVDKYILKLKPMKE